MKEKLEKFWLKIGKYLLWILLFICCGWLTYMVFVHRKVIRAAIKGEKLPEPPKGAQCCKFCK